MTNENDMNNLPAEAWEPLQQQEKDAEKIARPSLTFFQDGWRRLKDNKVAMISMVAIIVITLGAIVIPWFWPYSYKQQDLNLANLPAVMKVYPVDEENSVYVTPQYMLVLVSPKGELKGLGRGHPQGHQPEEEFLRHQRQGRGGGLQPVLRGIEGVQEVRKEGQETGSKHGPGEEGPIT